MYKVFIYDKPVLIDKRSKKNGSYEQLNSVGNVTDLISLLEHNEIEGVEVICEDPKKEWKLFKAHFKFIIAAGGTVFNDRKELLVIYRLGKWDLPKGKLEKGEDIPTCAIREVEEECNVNGLEIIKEVASTFHCYTTRKGKWALKRTYWYEMNTHYMGELIPQVEEGIERVEWVNKDNIESLKMNTYKSLIDVLDSID
ncbi:MAG: 8-oxo-dGTP pyrophosphatase MutT (NUDIX family) [Flavobacteriales bacterium]|jgi:8-oxo-dGTP pyrophosphatase MutT (NUDIX family)|tara:strand:- start:24076 stop:24669 length:594 start_codon:yes stop_codon:yes gene_type:complete